jgi:drug/metabolite transporter (DMT)-like permease
MTATGWRSSTGRVRLRRDRGTGLVLAFATACVSGVAVYANGRGVARFPDATTYTTAKNLVAALVLVAALAATSAARPGAGLTWPATARQRLVLASVAVVGGSLPFVLFFEGLARAGSTDAAFVHKTLVVWVAILAAAFLGERIGPAQLAAVGLLVGGQAYLGGGVRSIEPGAGEAMILAATLLWSVEVVVAKRLLATVSPLTVATVRMAGGVVVLVGWAIARGELAALLHLGAAAWTWAALVGGLLALYAATWFAALARAPAVDVTAVLVVGAVVTAGLDHVFAGAARPDPAGVGLAVAGVVLVLLVRSRPARAAVAS